MELKSATEVGLSKNKTHQNDQCHTFKTALNTKLKSSAVKSEIVEPHDDDRIFISCMITGMLRELTTTVVCFQFIARL